MRFLKNNLNTTLLSLHQVAVKWSSAEHSDLAGLKVSAEFCWEILFEAKKHLKTRGF